MLAPDETRTWKSLPDAPSSIQTVPPARSPLTLRDEGIPSRATPLYQISFVQESSAPFRYSPVLDPDPSYRASTSGSFLGRTADAASGIFVMRDISGKRRLNTPFFLGVLASVVIQSAYRPSGSRSASSTFNNFSSTLGSGAGRNVMQEFGPGIRQIVKEHTPNFLSRIKERVTRDQTSGRSVPIPPR